MVNVTDCLRFALRLGRFNTGLLHVTAPGLVKFTLLAGAIERNDRLVPPSICATALARKALLLGEQSRRCVCPHDFG